ncbi:MAG: glycosyltransferase [Microgenomates group bacterium]
MNSNKKLAIALCLPAYNEEANIGKLLESLLAQKTRRVVIEKIIVVSSASTDRTNEIVKSFIAKDSRISLIKQKKRLGKASAINAFLKVVEHEVVVIQSTDTICEPNTIELLCLPFLKDKKIGMTGGAPHPVNDKNSFLGYVVHTWWWFHRNIPRFGEIIAYRNVLPRISEKTAVDEAFIQAKMVQLGYKIVHVDEAKVWNKGAESLSDIIKQRRRIFNGHVRLYREEGIKIDSMTKSTIWLLLYKYRPATLKELIWLSGAISIEIFVNILGRFDMKYSDNNPYIWDVARSTKNVK